ncbi:hypothetical protein TASIC1_0007015700 [Trichoderma asperellum]|uniref:Uncharacterized protein n=1 Tax=Trichoderma asperellum TaxID=101201 RepID=A0A6V8QWP9_TRIAP|nr:hypothetical protein TASIC1_0007015700 [Trichoderma asperellum]
MNRSNRPALEYASRYSGNTALETSASQPPEARLHPQRPLSCERFPQRAWLAQAASTAIEHSAATGPAHSAHCVERVAHPPPPNVQPAVMWSLAAGSSRSPGAPFVQLGTPYLAAAPTQTLRAGTHDPSRPRPGFLM